MPQVFIPIAVAVTPYLTFFGLSSTAAAGIAITVIETGASLLLSAGLSYAASALQRTSYSDRGAMGKGANSVEIRLNTRQDVPPQRKIYGEVLVGGPLFFEESKNPLYYQGFLLSEGPITEVMEVRNTQEIFRVHPVIFGQAFEPFTNVEGRPLYVGRVKLCVRQGLIGQAIDPILAAAFPALDPATFLQRGVATLVCEAHFGSDFDENELLWGSSRRPNPIALIRGVPVYDPRNPRHVLPTDVDDPAEVEACRLTWDWSNTAALVQADYLWDPKGGRIPIGSLDWDRIARSADYDEGMIGTNEGPLIKRHTIDGVVTAGQQPLQILQSMLTANRGFIARSRGRVWVQSSQPIDKPVITITDDHIKGGIELRRAQPKRSLLNRVRSRFIDPRQQWTTVDGPIRNRTDLQALDGDIYQSTLDLPWTADHRRAQRIAEQMLRDSRLGRSIRMPLMVDTLGLDAGSVIRVDLSIYPRANGVYRLTEVQLSGSLDSIVITGAEYDPSIERDWNPETDELPFELPDLVTGDV